MIAFQALAASKNKFTKIQNDKDTKIKNDSTHKNQNKIKSNRFNMELKNNLLKIYTSSFFGVVCLFGEIDGELACEDGERSAKN